MSVQVSLPIRKIIIVKHEKMTDAINIELDLPPTMPFVSHPCASIRAFEGSAEDWVRANLPGVPVEIVTT